jgi:hypothetical protein
MPFAPIVLAFTFQATFWDMSKVPTFMLALSPRLAILLCLYRCPPLLCSTLVLSPLLFGVNFRFNLASYWDCLRLVSRAFDFFIDPLSHPAQSQTSFSFTPWPNCSRSNGRISVIPSPFVATLLVFTLYLRRSSNQWEVYVRLKKFMVGDWSFFQEESSCASCAFPSHFSLDDSSTIHLCRCPTLGRIRNYCHVIRTLQSMMPAIFSN